MKNAIVTFLIVAFLTSFPGLPVQAQYEEEVATIDVSQYYGGVETTNFGIYDPEAGVWVQVPVRRLPWWWTPPPDWVIWSTLGIATAAVVMSAVFIGEGLSFGSVFFNDDRYRGRLSHFHHFRNSVVGPRFRTHYGSARRDAERRHPEGLRHPPGGKHGPDVRGPGAGGRGPGGPGAGAVRGPNTGPHGPAGSGVRGPNTDPHGPGAGAVRGSGAGTRGPAGPGAVRGPNTGTRGPAGPGSGAVRGPNTGTRGPAGSGAVRGPNTGTRGPGAGAVRGPGGGGGRGPGPGAVHGPAPNRGGGAPRGGGGKPQPQRRPN